MAETTTAAANESKRERLKEWAKAVLTPYARVRPAAPEACPTSERRMRKFTLVFVWALAVLSSLAIQHCAMALLGDAWSVLLAAVVAGVTLVSLEWLRNEAYRAKTERDRLLAAIRDLRELQERAIDGEALRVSVWKQ